MTTARPIQIVFVASLLSVGCYRLWPGTNDVLGGSDCGMSLAAVQALLGRFQPQTFHSSSKGADGSDEFVAIWGGTHIHFGFEGDALRYVYYTWEDGFMHASQSLTRHLCKDELLVAVGVDGPPQLNGAGVALDGHDVDQLHYPYPVYLFVPLGRHTLTLQKGSYLFKRQLHYTASSNGSDFVSFSFPEPAERVTPNPSLQRTLTGRSPG